MPPTRQVWPPSRSLFEGWGVGEKKVPVGVCRRTSVQRGPRTCRSQRVYPRFGPCGVQRVRQSAGGGDRGRSDLVAGSPTGHRHNTCVPSARRRFGQTKSGRPQRALEAARRKKETTYPELALGAKGRERLVVLAAEMGDRWSNETSKFLWGLAKARAETEPMILQGRAKSAWLRLWSSLLACSAVRAFSESLLEQRPVPRTENMPLTHEVLREDRFWVELVRGLVLLRKVVYWLVTDFNSAARQKKNEIKNPLKEKHFFFFKEAHQKLFFVEKHRKNLLKKKKLLKKNLQKKTCRKKKNCKKKKTYWKTVCKKQQKMERKGNLWKKPLLHEKKLLEQKIKWKKTY